jgi:GAF domain-containing protein
MVGTPDPAWPAPPATSDEERPGRHNGDRPLEGSLLQLVLGTRTVEDSMDEIVRLAADLSPALAGCGITLRRDGHDLSVATSNALAAAVDEVQYGMNTGPCLETIDIGEIVSVPDLVTDDRWNGYPEHALAHGVRSSLSIPLKVSGRTVGALNSYGAEPEMFDRDLTDRLVQFAERAGHALALTLRNAQQADVVEQLHRAMQSRSVIDQALGIIMARQRCTSEEAFAVLRAASQSRNRKVADIAADLITATTGSPPREGRFDA